jgi:uncharacterized protein (TIGR03083 family)
MASNIPKDRTVAALGEVWASLGELLGELSDDEWRRPSPLPGWSVQDNVAHIVGTEAMLAGEPGPSIEIDREANAHVRNDIGAFNEQWVESLRAVPSNEVLSRFRELTGARLAALEAMSEEEWNAESFTPAGKDTYGRFMQIRVFDCWLHEQDIRDAVGRPGHETGLAVEVVLDEMATALGFVVGKKAGAEPGQSVTFALTDGGAVVRELNVEVGERAAVVPVLAGHATVVLTMPIGVMTRRCAGRVGPDDLLDQVVIDGDLALAAKILETRATRSDAFPPEFAPPELNSGYDHFSHGSSSIDSIARASRVAGRRPYRDGRTRRQQRSINSATMRSSPRPDDVGTTRNGRRRQDRATSSSGNCDLDSMRPPAIGIRM